MDKKTSPLKAKPLRHAGQSVQEQINKIVDDKVLILILFPVMLAGLAIYEWWRYYFQVSPQPIPFTVIALIVSTYATFRLVRIRKQIKNLKLGRDGEMAVGQYLEKLREQGAVILHDIIGENFNIDHILISEKGIYLIETKTYSKPHRVNPKVKYNNGKLMIDGLGDKSEILNQVKAATSWLTRILHESTGKTFLIKPVILFPGWYVESKDSSDIWVLEPKSFPKYLDNRKEIVSKEDKKLAAYHLSRYIRSI